MRQLTNFARLVLLLAIAVPAFAADQRSIPIEVPAAARIEAVEVPALPAITPVVDLAKPVPLALPPAANDASLALPASAALPANALPEGRQDRSLPLADHAFVANARACVARQLEAMSATVGRDRALMASISDSANAFLGEIDAHLKAGEIDPTIDLRTHAEDVPKAALDRPARVGFYPVAADPFHWGHLLIGLQAMAALKLDKVVFVLAGDDPRKPKMTPVVDRHPMGRAVLEGFAPFFQYSPIAVGTNYDGETNLFRFLAENASQTITAFYLVGDDHYRLTDKNGNDDTIPKIEKNRGRPELRFNPGAHEVSLAFIEREGRTAERVPTELAVKFLPNIPFEASSTHIRNGRQLLMPWDAYHWVATRGLGLYGIPPAGRPAAGD